MRTSLLAALLCAVTASLPVAAAVQRQIIGAEQDHSLAESNDCEHFYKTTFTTFRSTVHEQEQREFLGSPEQQMRIVASHEGGVSIRGWNRRYTRLVTCRYAAADTRADAQRVLDGVAVTRKDGQIVAEGPEIGESQAWWVNMILYVPRRATVDVRSANGGIAIRNMSGRVTASATSGGISVAQSSGEYRISTISGGITLERVNGKVDAVSRDGTIALRVAPGTVPSLEARTTPEGQILCTLSGCGPGNAWGAGGKTLRLGGGVPGIRITTSAPIIIGPVTD